MFSAYCSLLTAVAAVTLSSLPLAAGETRLHTPVKRQSDRARPSRRAKGRVSDTLQVTSGARRKTVNFVHSVWNLSGSPLRDVEITVALPSTDRRQTIHSLRYHPVPCRIETDRWGQRTGRFRLPDIDAGEKAEIRVIIDVTLREIEWWVTEFDVGAASEIPSHIRGRYLGTSRNYNLDSTRLREVAASVRARDESLLEKARRIHDFVTDHIEYERDDRWEPAAVVLQRGKGSCSEYCYLMIALCRLAGIPARYAGGSWIESSPLALVHMDRVFHRWVEVYLPRVGWFPIDATQNDRQGRTKTQYRYFGRLPWQYLTMMRGDGHGTSANRLKWDYRSNTRWRGYKRARRKDVLVDRYALWSGPSAGGPTGRRHAPAVHEGLPSRTTNARRE